MRLGKHGKCALWSMLSSNDAYSLSIRVETTINHISNRFLPQYQRQKEFFFFRALAAKGIAKHTNASSVVWTLIYNGKLAKQIARLAAIVVKKKFENNAAGNAKKM